jgi:hypothetical protein
LILLNPEDGGRIFLRNFGYHLPDCAMSHPRRSNFKNDQYSIKAELFE